MIDFLVLPQVLIAKLESSLSEARLRAYKWAADEVPELTLARYLWNTRLAEALYPVLNSFETALRNRLNAELFRQYGPQWYDKPWLGDVGARAIASAKSKLQNKNRKVTPDRLVAELTLGFWVALFYRDYEKHIWQTQGALQRVLPYVAPKNRRQLKNLRPRLETMRELRNRVSHHEPVWKDENLQQTHADLRELIQWMSLELASLTQVVDRFDEVFQAGEESLLPEIQQLAAHRMDWL